MRQPHRSRGGRLERSGVVRPEKGFRAYAPGLVGYVLGVDLGTTFAAAAIAREGRAEIASLGVRAAQVPSVVVVLADGEVLVGEAAERRSITEPTRTAREFKRRLGDPTPLVLGGTPYGAESLMGHLLRWIVDKVSEQQGEHPQHIVLTHPANWGPYKRDLLNDAVRIAGVGPVSLLTEPEAAAIHYSLRERIAPGDVVAVYDFGGGTFDAALLRRTGDGFEIVGQPDGIERLGGIDFDEAVFQHVVDYAGGAVDRLGSDDPAAVGAVAQLRGECREAKEALSSDTEATVRVLLPNVQTEVRLTRVEFEEMVRPRIADTISTMERVVSAARLASNDIARVLLVGGSSRIPLVAEMVQSGLGRPVGVDAHPKFAIAVGAALSRSPATDRVVAAETESVGEQTPAQHEPHLADARTATKTPKRLPLVAAAVVLVLGIAGVLLVTAGGDPRATSDTEVDTSTTSGSRQVTARDGTLLYVENNRVLASSGDGERVLLEKASMSDPVLSPDGVHVAYVIDGTVEIRDVASGALRHRLSVGAGSSKNPDWSPDGKLIAYNSNHEGSTNIYVASALSDAPETRRLTSSTAEEGSPDWSPDGRLIAYDSNEAGSFDVYVMDSDGGNVRRLTEGSQGDETPDWSPDGERIVFESGRDGNSEIYVMNADGTVETRLTNRPAMDRVPKFDPAGRVLFATDKNGDFDLFLLDVDTLEETPVVEGDADVLAMSWSPVDLVAG